MLDVTAESLLDVDMTSYVLPLHNVSHGCNGDNVCDICDR